ncbi:MAG: hypothetical protein R3F49_03435 [Planctomycetota bacterium]
MGWLRRTLLVVLALCAAAYAHRPLVGVGFLGDDARTLLELDTALREGDAGAYWRVDALHGRPLAAWSLGVSTALHAREGRYTPGDAGRLRLEGLVLLLVAALGMRVTVRRGLAPWTGDEHGRAAGFTAAVLLLVHPLAIPSAAHLGDRGDMLALAIGLWTIAVYLTFRQARSRVGVGVAWCLTFAASASSPMAYGLPVVLGVLELASADRHRRLARRVRMGVTTAAAFMVAVLLERVVRALLGGEASHVAQVDRSPLALFGVAAEKLGVLVLPVNTTGVGVFGYLLAVLAVLAALHPAFVAARAAPRLWGRILGAWAACIATLLVLTWSVRSAPAELGDTRALLAGAALMAAGLGVASTALSGARRTLLPALAVIVYAPLAAGSAATIEEAARRVGETHAALLRAGEQRGWDELLVVLDPPRKVAGVSALRPQDEEALVAWPFLPESGRPLAVFGLPSAALRLWTESPEFEAVRRKGCTFVMPNGGDPWTLDVPVDAFGTATLRWSGESASPKGATFDPLRTRALVATPLAEPTRDMGAPLLRFEAESPAARDGQDGVITGTWVREGASWAARFDLERQLDWMLAGKVRSLWLPGHLSRVEEVTALPALPSLPSPIRPRVVGADWVFDMSVAAPERALDVSEWVLARWDPVARTYTEDAGFEDGGLLRIADVATVGHAVVWSLERRVDGVTIARAKGSF